MHALLPCHFRSVLQNSAKSCNTMRCNAAQHSPRLLPSSIAWHHKTLKQSIAAHKTGHCNTKTRHCNTLDRACNYYVQGYGLTCICSSSSGTLAATSAHATVSLTPVSLRASMTDWFSMSLGPSSSLMGTPCSRKVLYKCCCIHQTLSYVHGAVVRFKKHYC